MKSGVAKRILVIALSVFALAAVFAPHAASADLLSGSLVPPCAQAGTVGFSGACQLSDLVALGENLLHFAVAFSVLVAALLFAYAGVLYFTAASSPDNIKKAHGVFVKVFVGLIIILLAFIIIDTIMQTLVQGNPFSSGLWQRIQPAPYPHTSGLPSAASVTGNGSISNPGGGVTCTGPGSGLCAPNQFGVFHGDASDASTICNAESGGDRLAGEPGHHPSRDKMTQDPAHRIFSFGLFQINATQHVVSNAACGGTFDCPHAFRGTNYDAVVINEPLYEQCRRALETPACNAAIAGQIFAGDGNWHQWSTHSCVE